MTRRLTRWGKWGGLAVTAMIVALLVATAGGRVLSVSRPSATLWAWNGRLQLIVFEPGSRVRRLAGVHWFRQRTRVIDMDTRPFPWSLQRRTIPSFGTVWMMPLWWLCAAAMLPTVGLWWLDRRARPGGCPGCGYNLVGLPAAGPCPECGAPQEVTS